MKRKMRQGIIGLVIAANMLVLAACGSANQSGSKATEEMSMDTATTTESVAMDSGAYMSDTASENASGIESQSEVISDTSQISGQKLIKDVSMSVETRTFDDFMNELTNQITSLGGYVESSDITGGSYQYENYRYAYVTARIPAEKLNGFVAVIKERGNVTQTSEQTTDVTLQYVDIESHLKALKIEQETLLNLLENATKMEDVIAIQSQLTQVRYEIESNESQIRTYDNLVNYSTVRINVSEVERETQADEKSFAGEIKMKLSDNLYAIKEGFRSFLIDFIAALPYIIIWGVILFALFIGGKKIYKVYRKKEMARSSNSEPDSKPEEKEPK
ncbi:DUF4349 domain-containing protein [Konateibacter massiliensis]|uniref:DUF4349 domain-containing protein n=1 Tax=Konateibacter massiliensis TaxID=2002841 RepID=UPI0015D5103A|nr:DUF4349 domain-containing protein [Konateibacter massiliensis]